MDKKGPPLLQDTPLLQVYAQVEAQLKQQTKETGGDEGDLEEVLRGLFMPSTTRTGTTTGKGTIYITCEQMVLCTMVVRMVSCNPVLNLIH